MMPIAEGKAAQPAHPHTYNLIKPMIPLFSADIIGFLFYAGDYKMVEPADW
ncbi:hypothetical protein AB6A23_19825 [Paenibacillus tarimensis]